MARSQREIAIEHGLRFIGKPYIWAGQGATGLDCSGLIVEILRAVGKVGRKFDATAQGLFDRFASFQRRLAEPGDLIFFGRNPGSITHVGMCVDITLQSEVIVLEAAGGRRGVDTPEEAQKNGAMVTLRPMRDDVVAICNPWT